MRSCAYVRLIVGARVCMSMAVPPSFLFVLMRSHVTTWPGCSGALDFAGLLWRWNQLKRKHPDCPFGRRVDLYLSRNAALPDKGTLLCLSAATEMQMAICTNLSIPRFLTTISVRGR